MISAESTLLCWSERGALLQELAALQALLQAVEEPVGQAPQDSGVTTTGG